MQYFSVYDVLLKKADEKHISIEEMYSFFKKHNISKKKIDDLQQTVYIADEKTKMAILAFLEMTELELCLHMGIIPPEYRDSFFANVKEISQMLKKQDKLVEKIKNPYYENDNGKLYNDDCIKVLRNIPDETVDMVFADPPFNLGKTYDPGVDDDLTMSQYLNWTYDWLDECIRVLKPGGRIFIYNLPRWCIYIADYLGKQLTYWDWIAIDMKYTLPIQNRLYPAHYALVSYVKGTKATTFNNQRIPMQVCRHCGGELKDYGGYKDKMNPEGINVSDVWTDIYPVRHKNTKNRKYNELPVKLLDRIISMSTNPGDMVLDPFGGSGTTYAVAQALGRKWIGTELGDCEVIKNRLINNEQDLRQLEKIYSEKGKLFTEETIDLRTQNGFWTCESVRRNTEQITLEDYMNNKKE